ncbi:hypothetical protein E1295_12115 [Nonomuraea mesophila]|uniref:Uncharacterized protein n=1 Tax=Nonomuraea mesophila TaxID=2530382 RepID=A0A4R5FS24_9ACTN|nr:hypothetical protein [Nonomuraea mesophila]TDE55994.1 hypothetical protein E1295_12115 [Nonomuraea mesophila]
MAAALAGPVQAEALDSRGVGTTTATSPLGGVLDGGVATGLVRALFGATAQPVALTEAEKDALAEARRRADNQRRTMGTANSAEDVVKGGDPLTELSPIVGGFSPLGNGRGSVTSSLPLLSGAARMAETATPSVKTFNQGRSEVATQSAGVHGVVAAMAGLAESSFGSTLGKVPAGGGAPVKGIESLSAEASMAGLTQAAKNALPGIPGGRLSTVVGKVAPAEAAPVAEALTGLTQAATLDGAAPLVEEAAGAVESSGTKAAASYRDVVTALGWSTSALTSSVRQSWDRD